MKVSLLCSANSSQKKSPPSLLLGNQPDIQGWFHLPATPLVVGPWHLNSCPSSWCWLTQRALFVHGWGLSLYPCHHWLLLSSSYQPGVNGIIHTRDHPASCGLSVRHWTATAMEVCSGNSANPPIHPVLLLFAQRGLATAEDIMMRRVMI